MVPTTSPTSSSTLSAGNLTVTQWLQTQRTLGITKILFQNSFVQRYYNAEVRSENGSTLLAVEDHNYLKFINLGGKKYTKFPWFAHGRAIIMNHILSQELSGIALEEGTFQSWSGNNHSIHNNTIVDAGTSILQKDVYRGVDGIVHIVGELILPSWFKLSLEVVVLERYPDWYAYLEKIDMLHLLRGDGAKTIVIPKWQAIESIPQAVHADVELLREIMLYHFLPDSNLVVAPVEMTLSDVHTGDHILVNNSVFVQSGLKEHSVNVTIVEESMGLKSRVGYINGVKIIEDDVLAHNGVIQIMDQVLVPESLRDRLQIR